MANTSISRRSCLKDAAPQAIALTQLWLSSEQQKGTPCSHRAKACNGLLWDGKPRRDPRWVGRVETRELTLDKVGASLLPANLLSWNMDHTPHIRKHDLWSPWPTKELLMFMRGPEGLVTKLPFPDIPLWERYLILGLP